MPPADNLLPPGELDAELAAIPTMSWTQLRQRWTEVTGRPHPRVRHALLRLALSWELQARAFGGHSRRSLQLLEQMSDRGEAEGRGLKLVREWKGVLHTVSVDADGGVHWNGRTWNSLSEVARAITGTRWSGPAFFGLKQKVKAAGKQTRKAAA